MMSTVSEKLLQVAENVSKVYHAGQMNVVENAECLKGFNSDTAMLLDDVSPVTHEMGVRVRGKNLLDIQNPVTTVKDPIITYNSITATKDLASATYQVFIVSGTYRISAIRNGYSTLKITDSNGNEIYYIGSSNNLNYTFTLLSNDTLAFRFAFSRFTETGETSLSISNIQLELGSTATDYEPYNSDIQNVHSKNLIPYPYAKTTETVNGITFTDNDDGTITINGTATANITYAINQSSDESTKVSLISGCTYTLSGCPSGGGSSKYFLRTGGTKSYVDYGSNVSFTATSDYINAGIVIQIMNGVTVANLVFKPQLELGSTATAYTPYHEPYPLVVSRYGKNLFDYDNVRFSGMASDSTAVKENNGFTLTTTNSAANYFYTSQVSAFGLKPNTTYTSRAIVTLVNNGSSSITSTYNMGLSLLLQTNQTYDSGTGKVYIVDGFQNGKGVYATVGTHEIITTFTTPTDMTSFKYIVTRVADNCSVIFKDLQVQLGDNSSKYEPYISPTEYTPNTDGTVNGVESLYPSTTLLTNDPYGKVYIDCDYYKDIDKAFNELTTSVALSGGE